MNASALEALNAAAGSVRRHWRLTPRWLPMEPHPQQSLFCYHPSRFKINPSGRRSGKTELVKRKAVLQLVRRRAWPAKIFLSAPSFGQARDIFWDDVKALVPPAWVGKISESRLELITRWGALIRIIGFDRPRRIEGVPWDYAACDELADSPRRCFSLNVRPAMATRGRNGACDLIGVPDEVGRNQAEYEQLFDEGLTWPNKRDICSFRWRSAEIIGAAEVAAMADEADTLAYSQELEGAFVTSGDKAVPDFDPAYHVQKRFCEYDPRLPLDWSLDFGTSPACSILSQSWQGAVWVLDEIVIQRGSTDAQVEAFRARVADRGWHPRSIRLFGDAAGHQHHSPLGNTDYEILEEHTRDLPIEWRQLEAPPRIKDTLNAVRTRVKARNGHVRLHVHPRCKLLAEDMKTAPWPDKLNKYHALAALRYYCYSLFGSGTGFVGSAPLVLPNMGGS